jgi:thioredoxin-dependent peroxiredoxin
MIRVLLCLSALCLFENRSNADPSAPLPVGARAPAVIAPDQDGRPLHFADVYAKGITLVFFFPAGPDFWIGAESSASLAEVTSLRDAYDKLHGEGLQIIGVSLDNASVQKKFKQDNRLPYTLIADIKGKAGTPFGTRIYGGGDTPHRYERVSFIVKDGKIAWNSLKAQTSSSAEEVQKALDGLK